MAALEKTPLFDVEDNRSTDTCNTRRFFFVGAPTVLVATGVALFVVLWLIPYFQPTPNSPLQRAMAIQDANPLIDGHNDVPWQYRNAVNDSVISSINFGVNVSQWNTDLPRMAIGKVGAQFWSVYTPCNSQGKDAVRETLEQIDLVHKLNRRYSDKLQLALNPNDIRNNFANKKISSLIGIEGGHQIDASMGALRMMYQIGARYMTLTHNCNNEIADAASNGCSEDVDCRIGTCVNGACTAPQTIGLTPFGEQVVLEMNRLGMLVDISHVSPAAMRRVLAVTQAPVIFSHSSAYALCNHVRNVPNDVLLTLKNNSGIVMIAFLNNFITCSNNATLEQVVDHIDYIARGKCPNWKPDCNPNNTFPGIGVDNIGYGSDFDGADYFPTGLNDVSKFVDLTAALISRGYDDASVIKIIGGNLLRVFDAVVAKSNALNATFPNEEVIWPNRACRLNQ